MEVVVDSSSLRTFQTSCSSKSPFLKDRQRAVVRAVLAPSMGAGQENYYGRFDESVRNIFEEVNF